MKRLIVFFCVAMMCASCKPWGDGNRSVRWYVHNTTEQTLIFKCPYSESLLSDDYEYREFEIVQSINGTEICRGENLKNSQTSLDYYFKRSAEVLGEDVSWQILSKDGVVLKTWKYSEARESEQRFFYNEEWGWEGFLSSSGVWRFYIIDDDIRTNKITQ